MNRKTFLTWGLATIVLATTLTAVSLYLAWSRIIEPDTIKLIAYGVLILPILVFAVLLHFRFKEIGRRKRALALCTLLYLLSLPLAGFLMMLYINHAMIGSGAETRFFGAIRDWASQNDLKSDNFSFSVKQKLDFILVMLPAIYLKYFGLFALLAFGCLDPRKPSKNRVTQFLKTGFEVKGKPKVMKFIKLAEA